MGLHNTPACKTGRHHKCFPKHQHLAVKYSPLALCRSEAYVFVFGAIFGRHYGNFLNGQFLRPLTPLEKGGAGGRGSRAQC